MAMEDSINKVVASSLRGEGALSTHLGQVKANLIARENANNSLREAPLASDQIAANVKKQLDDYATKQLAPALLAAAKGESAASGIDLNQMAGMAGAVGQASSAISGGSLLGILSVIPAIMNNFGEYISAAFAYFMGDKSKPDAPKSFSEALANIRAPKAVEELAHKLGADPKELLDAVRKPAPNAASAKSNAPAAGDGASTGAAMEGAMKQASVAKPATPVVASRDNFPEGEFVHAPLVPGETSAGLLRS